MSNASQSVLEYQRSHLYRLAASPYPEWSLSALCNNTYNDFVLHR